MAIESGAPDTEEHIQIPEERSLAWIVLEAIKQAIEKKLLG